MNRSARLLIILAVLAIAARLFQLAGLHPLVWDEIEFFRATDWVRQGLVPYRDFWEHHTPLQWFLFAPMSALIHGPGAGAIILMRWAQLPLWVAAFIMLRAWMRRAGASELAAWSAMTLVLCSTLFMLPAVEYRVDVLGCVVYIAALLLLQRMDDGRAFAFFGGAMLCLAGLANLRLGPLAVITLLFVRIVRTRERAWGGNTRANWSFAGAAAASVTACAYFVVTHSALVAWQRLWTDNLLADRYAHAPVNWMFLHRFAVAFGLRLIDYTPNFQPSSVDPGGIAIVVIGIIGVVHALRRGFRAPDDNFFLAFLQVANILFIAAMKFIFNYHLEIVVLLMMPLVAMEVDHFVTTERRRRALFALVFVAAAVNISAAVFRGKERDTQYEDFIMREVDRLTPPGAKVLDGVGWGLHRDPAYRYWFLRENVFVMERYKYFESYTIDELIRDPPAVVVAEFDIRRWMLIHRQLAGFIVTHYLPFWREIWLPGMSARLTPERPAAGWIVLSAGTYDIYASTRLASHPWFPLPLNLEHPLWRGVLSPTSADRDARIEWRVDGVPVQPSPALTLTLRRGQQVEAVSREPQPVGIMLIGSQNRLVFCRPTYGVTLEASENPYWHVPDLVALVELARGTGEPAPRDPCRR